MYSTHIYLSPRFINQSTEVTICNKVFFPFRYYSDPSRKYLTFEYPKDFTDKDAQKEALLSAFELAHALDRTLILPAFNCPNLVTKHCNYQRRFPKTPFYLDVIEGQYREHVFLQHPKVPKSIKFSQSEKVSFEELIEEHSKTKFHDKDIHVLTEYLSDFDKYAVLNLGDLHMISIKTNSGVRKMLDKM